MTSIACNNTLVTKETIKNRDRINEAISYFNSKKLTTQIYGKIGSLEDNSPATRALETFLKDQDEGLVLDESFGLKDSQIRRLKLRIDEHERQMNKPLGYLESIIKIPAAVMRKTPFAKDFYQNLDVMKNYERNKMLVQATALKSVTRSFRLAYQEAGFKTGYYTIDTFKKIAKLENEAKLTDDPQTLKEISKDLNQIIKADEGALIRDYNTLISMTDAEFKKAKKEGIRGQKYGADVEKKAGRFGQGYSPHILDAVEQSRLYLNDMGNVNKNALRIMRDAVWVKVSGKTYADNKGATIYNPTLKSLDKSVNEAIKRIEIGMKQGGYFPQIAVSEVMHLKAKFNKILNAKSVTNMSQLTAEISRDMDSMIQLNPPSNIKARNELVQRRWAENPLFVLEQYGAQAIQFNKLNSIALEYEKILKILNHPNLQKGGPKYLEGLADFIHDEYTLATKGLQNRPEWLNDTVRTIRMAETMKAMGLGITGAIRNVAAVQFFFTNMGLSTIARTKDLYKNGVIPSSKMPGGQLAYSSLVERVGKIQGFEFADIGLELVAEGILTKEGAEKLDFRFNDQTGQIEAKNKRSTTWQNFEKIANMGVSKSLLFHRWGENFSRKYMFRSAFIEALEKYRSNPEYWVKNGGDRLDLDNPMANKLIKDAANVALFAVNKFAGEYALHAKSRVLTGHPGKTNINGEVINKAEVNVTAATSLATGLLHYPMFFMDMQYNMIKGGVYSAMAKQWDSPEIKYIAKYAAVFTFIQGLSVLLNTDFNRIAENDTIEKMKSLYANIQGPDPDQVNPDGTLKDNAKGLYGLINEVTGPSVDDMFFLLMHNGVMNLPDSELGRIAFGYDRYLETQNAEAKDRAFWNKLGTFSGFMANKALPAIRNARGWDITRHAFAAYPSEFTRNSRDWIGEEKELMGIKIPGIPLFKRKKKRLLSTRLNYLGSLKTDGTKVKRDKYRSPLEEWRLSLEKKKKNYSLKGFKMSTDQG